MKVVTEKIYIPKLDLTLKYYIDEYSRDNVYDLECELPEEEFYSFREFAIQEMVDGGYFECVINEELKEVRFGVISHKKTEDGYVIKGPIVERAYDEKGDNTPIGNNFKVNIEDQVLRTKIINDRLIDFLTDKGIMSNDEKGKILDVSRKEILEKYFEYNTF